MRRLFAAAALGTTIAWLALPGSPALACTCDALAVHAHVEAADAVFAGRVTAITTAAAEQEITLRVSRVYKGEVQPLVAVRTAGSPETCGIQFARESEYLVFARSAANGYTTSLCSGTTDDLAAVERVGMQGREVLATSRTGTAVAARSERPAGSRSMPIALAGVALVSVFAVHARRFSNLARR